MKKEDRQRKGIFLRSKRRKLKFGRDQGWSQFLRKQIWVRAEALSYFIPQFQQWGGEVK